MTAVHSLWVYDYLLTLGDEIKYAWSGRRSWIFALFVAVRRLQMPPVVTGLIAP
ncbi:hypothetical protein BDM02DRAFT_3118324 [Thelephora ganbajun]|uniref:Uncharacterized protein n=1 Tax=Thelephora ganbajun TaxID=370292 RepID=A0ACB6ZAQ5_THEGA|nr:hypothetical protein BDM02DRAFT_3118324 [Thelephora ganbajun]